MIAIYKREMKAYFASAIGYIFSAVFFALSGLIFSLTTLFMRTSEPSNYFVIMMFLFIILIPILTMKLFSEERKLKTEQILLTSPVSLFGMVFAKFAAAFTMFAGTFIASCLVNFVTLAAISKKSLNIGSIAGSVIGILFIGGVFISIGILLSSLTENQLIAAVSTIGTIIFMLSLQFITSIFDSPAVRNVIKWFSVIDRFTYFTNGIFSVSAIIFFISLIIIFLFLTIRVFEKRRWE